MFGVAAQESGMCDYQALLSSLMMSLLVVHTETSVLLRSEQTPHIFVRHFAFLRANDPKHNAKASLPGPNVECC